MSTPANFSPLVRASDLVGCRFRLRQRLAHPEVPPLVEEIERQPQIAAARAAVREMLPVKRAVGDGAARRFRRVDLPAEATPECEDATRAAVLQGADLVTNAVLTGRVAGVDVIAEVDVLVRVPARGAPAQYMPVMISNHRVARPVPGAPDTGVAFVPTARLSLGKPITVAARLRHHTIDGYRVALAHLLLGRKASGRAAVIGQDRSRAYLVDPARSVPPLVEALQADIPAEPRRLKQCASCRFWPLCEPRLRELDDLSLVFPGGRSDDFRARGIHTVQGLIDADVGEPSRIAQAWREGVPVLKRVGALAVPRADVEVDVDMEAYLDQGAYLWGAFDGEAYHAFVTWDEVGAKAEEENFAAFWRWLMGVRATAHAAGKTFRAYCYAAGGENHWLRSSAQRFGCVELEQVQRFIASDEWVDVFAYVRRHLVGTDGLGLKVLGPIAGFHWEDDDVDGQRSVALRLAARHGDEEARETLLRYNEDDCRSTRAVRDFLSSGAPGVPQL